MEPATPSNTTEAIRVLKIGTCPSLAGSSSLTYHIGCNAEAEIHIRLQANSGTGCFNPYWISLSAIQKVLDRGPAAKPITSSVLYPLFKGKSLNSPCFLLAVLKAEGLISPSEVKRRGYELTGSDAFLAKIQSLVASNVTLTAEEQTPKSAGKSSPSGKKANRK